MADTGEAAAADPRFAWLRGHLVSSLRCPEMKVDRLFANEESSSAVLAFFDDAAQTRLIVHEVAKGELAASVRGAASPPRVAVSASALVAAAAVPRARRRVVAGAGAVAASRDEARLAGAAAF